MQRNLRAILTGSTIGIICCILILLLCSVMLSVQDIPQGLIDPMAIAAAVIGSFIAGFCGAKIRREMGLLIGLCCGITIFLFIVLAGFAISDNSFGPLALIKLAMVLFSSMLGGVLGVNSKNKHRA